MSTQAIAEQTAIRWLGRLNSPELSAKEESAFFEWLNHSPENQCAYLKAEKLWTQATVVSKAEPQTSFFERWFTFQPILNVTVAAVCLIAISTFFFLRTPETHQAFHTAIGEQNTFMLNDGSNLLLNTDTSIRIELSAARRIAYLDRGEVLFTISKDKNRPFDVITTSGKVRVVGTQFSVREKDDDALVTVIEGRVNVENRTLSANQQISIKQAIAGASINQVNASESLAWRKRELIYRGQTLDNVISDLNRYYKEEIILGDTALKSKEVVAVLHLSTVEETTEVLARSLNITAEYNPASRQVTFKDKVKH